MHESAELRAVTLAVALLVTSAQNALALTFGFEGTCYDGTTNSRPYVPILEKPRTLFSFDIRVCEDHDFINMVVFGTRKIESGQSIMFDWETEFWEGEMSLEVESDLSSRPQTGHFTAAGVIQHSDPPMGDAFEWELEQEGEKHATQPRANEPAPARIGGTVEHDSTGDDSYTVEFRVDPEVTFFTGGFAGPPVNPNDLGWLVEITGRHGAAFPDIGPFGRPGRIRFPVVGNNFNDDFGLPPVPLPAAVWMLLTAGAVAASVVGARRG